MRQQSNTFYQFVLSLAIIGTIASGWFAYGYYQTSIQLGRDLEQAKSELESLNDRVQNYREQAGGTIIQSASERVEVMNKIVSDFKRGFFGKVEIDLDQQTVNEQIEGVSGIDPVEYRQYTFTVTLRNPVKLEKMFGLTERLRNQANLQEYEGTAEEHTFVYQLRTPTS